METAGTSRSPVRRGDHRVTAGRRRPSATRRSSSTVLGISGRAYLGLDGILRYLDVESAWKQWRVEVHRILDGPDGRVLTT